ncbi:site-specific integrase [Paraburkholderia elongata]|uniref:Tyrosine-type recombinase/integrase n=1 Tax=Paraburkholderia elongata TaxID=2675747 RepID=A0A972P0B9_9BURK|nr:site-specific integrase [Paraburkholderia elongata]NPT62506.1 tyrosine-type recombinase/integrase [Paraburkholderia elongata]
MEKSTHQVSSHLPLQQFVAGAVGELERLHYSRRTLARYRAVWRHLIGFCHEMSLEDQYSQELAEQFCTAYQMYEGECLNSRQGWRRHIVFALKVLEDFARDGHIERTVTDMQKIQVPAPMSTTLRDYELYCRDRRHLRTTTLRERMREIAIFADFLGSRNITFFDQMQPADLCAFVTSQHRLAAKSVSRIVSDVRGFLRFLLLRGILQQDLSHVLPVVHVPRDATIPSVWDPNLVIRLLEVVDRTSPKGKRDYAILLLACRLGLRAGDIRTLSIDDLKWETATIEIKQSKSLAPLCLPLTEEVGEALIDYLRSGRPQSDRREVFLTLNAPFQPFCEAANLHYIVKHWKTLAGIRFRSPQRHGLHSLRHTLATRLLHEQTPFQVISDILGHATTASTLIYAKTDVETLRTAALNTEEMRHVE